MRSLSSFLSDRLTPEENVLYVVSDRFLDAETGQPEQWEIKRITAKENSAIRKACMRTVPVPGGRKGQYTQDFDANLYQAKVSAACTVWPDLDSAELQDSYHVVGAENLLQAMLRPGEFEDYSAMVLEVNGFKNKDDLIDEAKN